MQLGPGLPVFRVSEEDEGCRGGPAVHRTHLSGCSRSSWSWVGCWGAVSGTVWGGVAYGFLNTVTVDNSDEP